MLRLATISVLLAAPLVAQTTWTSFEDRKGHAIASDSAGGVLMFGGESSTSAGEYLDDTNAFANPGATATWTQLNPFVRPTPRTEHAMAAGSSTDDAAIFILFGGLAVPTTGGPAIPNGETFIYDGSGWGNGVLHATGPSARTGHTMLTDPIRNRVVLFGGLSSGFAQNDLWEFDPINDVWISVIANAQPGSPPPRYDHSMAFHPGFGGTTSRIYLFGGTGFKFDTWEYDPTAQTWTNVTPMTRPSGRRRAAMAYLPAFDNIVLFGGQDNTLTALNDTWVWDSYAVPPTWTQSTPATTPPARWDHALAPDQLGNNAVLLGGDNGSATTLEGTWLWNGVDWIEELPPPSPRSDVAMTYDRDRNRHPVFGGRTIAGGTDLDETWELDGLNWRERMPSTKPSARADAGMAYDSMRSRTVLYGGRTGGACGTELGDTWEWDGQNWSPRVLANNPPTTGGVQPVFDTVRNVTWMLVGSEMWSYDGADWSTVALPEPRQAFGSCYDTTRGRLVIFGGSHPTTFYNSDTWEWDGTWHYRGQGGPPVRNSFAMIYDAARQESVLLGGFNGGVILSDTWKWDGSAWSQGQSLPSVRYNYGFAFESAQNRAILFGGAAVNSIEVNDTWQWDGASWAQLSPTASPSARQWHHVAYDPGRNRVVLFGGFHQPGGTQTSLGDTWEFDGASWVQQAPSISPPPRQRGGFAYDPVTASLLLVGGQQGWSASATVRDDTWLWDGSNWTLANPAVGAPPRYWGLCVGDGTRVLFGFGFGTTRRHSDLWAWDGQTWELLDSGSPPPRTNYGAAYDARRDRVVIFGGRDSCGSGNYLNGTWEWNGDSWLQRFPTNEPSPRERSKLTFDESRGRVVLFGGTDGTNTFSDTWEWDGDDWIARLPISSPPGSSGHGLSYDQQRRVTVAFGSLGTWDYGPTNPANFETFGVGCPGSNGTPSLEPLPWAGPWLGGQLEVDIINQPPGLGIFVWGFSETLWLGQPLPYSLAPFGGGPGCDLLVSDDVHELFLSGTNPYVSFLLPSHPSLLGNVMRAQAGFLDTGLGGAPVVTHALRMTFGSK